MIANKKFTAAGIGIEQWNALKEELQVQVIKQGILESLILEYEYGKGKLQHVHVIEDSFEFNNEASGRFKAGYELNEFSLCAAIDYTATETMTINFRIDKDTDQITLTGEQRNERFDEL